jgi:POT family proton-dependent oligopeptide transporter
MAIGIIIMGLDFYLWFCNAVRKSGTSSMIWLVLAYLFHTIGDFVFRQ